MCYCEVKFNNILLKKNTKVYTICKNHYTIIIGKIAIDMMYMQKGRALSYYQLSNDPSLT